MPKVAPFRLWSICALLLFLGGSLTAASDSSPIELEHDAANGEIAVFIRGEHFTTFHYGSDLRTPFLWPIYAEGGVGVTRNFPMGTDDPESTDHPHHRSLHFTFGSVNGYDFWHQERIATKAVETGAAEKYAWIRAKNEWLKPDGEPVLRETQEWRFHNTAPAGRWIDFISTLTAVFEDVTFVDHKEGLLAVRIRPEIEGRRAGILTNAEGQQGERTVYGTRSKWMDYSGPVGEQGVRGIAIFDHPANLRHPPPWHARDYGLIASNPFGLKAVAGTEEDGAFELKKGKSITFAYRLYVHSGDVDVARVAQRYEEFVENFVQPTDPRR